jgi:plasmid maintenance system antidote protein VapI
MECNMADYDVIDVDDNDDVIDEVVKTYMKLVREQVKNFIQEKHLTQEEFSQICKIPQGNISNMIFHSGNISLKSMVKFAKAMDIELHELLNLKLEKKTSPSESTPNKSNGIIIQPNDIAFKGYLGKYFFYSHSTIRANVEDTHNKRNWMKGVLLLEESSKDINSFCKTTLTLSLEDGESNSYVGQTWISTPMSSCFSVLNCEEYFDTIFLIWEHKQRNNGKKEKLPATIAACMSPSRGKKNRPTMIKAILSRKELTSEDLINLNGQLSMTSKSITIEKDTFTNFVKNNLSADELECLTTIHRFETLVYSWEESEIRNYNFPNIESRVKVINLLRRYSLNLPYIKISEKATAILEEYLEHYE